MKKILSVIIAMAICAGVSAQKKDSPAIRAHSEAKKVQVALSLGNDETAKMEEAYLARYTKVEAIEKNTSLSETDANKQKAEATKAFNKTVKETLSEEKFTDFQEYLKTQAADKAKSASRNAANKNNDGDDFGNKGGKGGGVKGGGKNN